MPQAHLNEHSSFASSSSLVSPPSLSDLSKLNRAGGGCRQQPWCGQEGGRGGTCTLCLYLLSATLPPSLSPFLPGTFALLAPTPPLPFTLPFLPPLPCSSFTFTFSHYPTCPLTPLLSLNSRACHTTPLPVATLHWRSCIYTPPSTCVFGPLPSCL